MEDWWPDGVSFSGFDAMDYTVERSADSQRVVGEIFSYDRLFFSVSLTLHFIFCQLRDSVTASPFLFHSQFTAYSGTRPPEFRSDTADCNVGHTGGMATCICSGYDAEGSRKVE